MGFNMLDKGKGGMVGRDGVGVVSDNKKIISEFFICFFAMKLLLLVIYNQQKYRKRIHLIVER